MFRFRFPIITCVVALTFCVDGASTHAAPGSRAGSAVQSLVADFCVDCHDATGASADLDLTALVSEPIGHHRGQWERVVRRLRTRQMPPADAERPDEATYQVALNQLERELDHIAAQDPQPGRTETFRRLTRYEYRNAIRDLLEMDIDVDSLVPAD